MRALCALGWALARDLEQVVLAAVQPVVVAPPPLVAPPPPTLSADGRPVRLVGAGQVCGGNSTDLGFVATPQKCADAVVAHADGWAHRGLFFAFGSGVGTPLAGSCAAVDTSAQTCPEGLQASPDLDFFAVDTLDVDPEHVNATCTTFRLVRSNQTCAAAETDLGLLGNVTFANVTACGVAAQSAGAKFFTFGIAGTAGAGTCKSVAAASAECAEGWAPSTAASFYAVDFVKDRDPALWISQGNVSLGAQGLFVDIARPGYSCGSDDVALGNMSLRECAKLVASHGGRFLAYGPGLACRMELTADASCPEGWSVEHSAGFYALGTVPPSVNAKAGLMPPCLQKVDVGVYMPQTVVSGVGRAMVRRGANPPLDPGVEALKEARDQRARVVAFRNGLLRGAKAHAAALAPQKKMDATGTRELEEEKQYEWEGP